jgi:NitT/TauT family transport system substrate-binding protein
MKKLTFFALLGFVLGGAAAAQNLPGLTIYSIRGPSGVGLIRLFEDPPRLPGFSVRMEALAQADLVAARFIAGEAKVGILPPNVAAKIASSGKTIKAAAVIGTGMLSLLSSDPAVNSIGDLRGKTVAVAGQGATPDYVFRKILMNRGLDPGRDLNLNYSLAYPEIAQSLIAGRVASALLPEPFATMARLGRPDLKAVSDIQREWTLAGGEKDYPMTVLVVDGAFAASFPEAVAAILEAVRGSIAWTAANPAEAGRLVEKHDLGLRAQAAAAAIPRSGYVYIEAAEARPSMEALFRVFLDFAPQSIGGSLPRDDFYYLRGPENQGS